MIKYPLRLTFLVFFLLYLLCCAITVGHFFLTKGPSAQLSALLPSTHIEGMDERVLSKTQARFFASQSERINVSLSIAHNASLDEKSNLLSLKKVIDQAEKSLTATGVFSLATPPIDVKDLQKTYAAYAPYLLTQADRDSFKNPEPNALESRLWYHLSSPNARPFLGFAQDPLGTFDRRIEAFDAHLPIRANIDSGKVIWLFKAPSQGRLEALLFLSAKPNLAQSGEGLLTQTLEKTQKQLNDSFRGNGVQLSANGLSLFTDRIAQSAHHDVQTIGLLSILGLLLLGWSLFGSFVPLLWMSLSIGAGLLSGLALCLWLTGSCHLLTLVFGTSLMGVAIDYPSHWFVLKGDAHPEFTLEKLKNPLILASTSTAFAYAAMLFTPLEGLLQMGIMASGGILTSALIVLLVFPLTQGRGNRQERPTTRLLSALNRGLVHYPRWIDFSPLKKVIAIVFLAALFAVGLTDLKFSSGLRDFQALPSAFLLEQQRLAERLEAPSPAQFFVVKADCEETLLLKEEALIDRLKTDPLTQTLVTQSLSKWVPSRAKQKESLERYQGALATVNPLIESLLGNKVTLSEKSPLEVSSLQGSKLMEIISPFYQRHEKEWLSCVFLSGLSPEMLPQLSAIAQTSPGVFWGNTTEKSETALSTYRDRLFLLAAIAFALLSTLLGLRYQLKAYRALVPTLLGILIALALMSLLGYSFTIFSALAIILLLGLGVDYGIFFLESPENPATGSAVLFSTMTTLLSFGLLSLSSTPALQNFGLLIGFGLTAIFFLTPLLRASSR